MAITDWTKPLFGNMTDYLDPTSWDREATYMGFKPGVVQGFDWTDPNSKINVGGQSFNNPFQYGSAANGYAGLNGLQNTDGWQTYGSGDSEYKVYADQQQGAQAGVMGQIGAEGTDARPVYGAQSGNRMIGAIKDQDPELWKVLEPYANAYGSWTPDEGYTIPEEYYKAATSSLGRWTTKGDWKGPASVISLILSAVGGQLLTGAGIAGEAGAAGSAFPSAAGDGFYNWANAAGGGFGGAGGGAGGGLLDSATYGINPATGSPYQMPLPMGTNGAPVLPANGMYGNFAINPATGLPFSMPLPSGVPPTQTSDPSAWVGGEGNATIPTNSAWNPNAIPQDYFQNLLQGGTGVGAEAAAGSASLWDQIKSIYDSPEAQMAKTIASGTQSALNAAQQAGLLGGGQAQASGGGGSMGLLGAQSGGRGRSFAELSPYARGLLRG